MSKKTTILLLPQKGCEDLEELYYSLDQLAESRGGLPSLSSLVTTADGGLSQLALSWAKERGVPATILSSASGATRKSARKDNAFAPFEAFLSRSGGQVGEVARGEPDDLLAFGVDSSYVHIGGRYDLEKAARWAQSASVPFIPFDQGEKRRQKLAASAQFYRGIKDEDDGTRFINVYSRGRSLLGRQLSNFTAPISPLRTQDGPFASVEGYWFYLGTSAAAGEDREALRKLSGYQAKNSGGTLRERFPARLDERLSEPEFRSRIKEALVEKLLLMPELAQALEASTQPLCHYYVYGSGNKTSLIPGDGQWLIDVWEWLRSQLR